MVHVRPIPPGGLADGVLVIAALPSKADADLAFLGPALADEVAKAIAEGMTLQLCTDSFSACKHGSHFRSACISISGAVRACRNGLCKVYLM